MRFPLFPFLLLLVLGMTMAPSGRAIPDPSPQGQEKWYENLRNATPQLTKLHFYAHDFFVGPNQSIYPLANASITATSPTSFGLMSVLDDVLTEGPEFNSTRVGKAQGTYISASLNGMGLLLAVNFVFQEGELNGSVITCLGYEGEGQEYWELPIVGGSGVFRLATGSFSFNRQSVDPNTGNLVVQFQAYVLHPVEDNEERAVSK